MIHTDPDYVFIIAEAGVNHNGRKELAFSLIDAAAEAGADAVKFQTFSASKLVGQTAPKAKYQKRNTNAHESQFEMLSRLELPFDWHRPLQAYAKDRGIKFISTAFDIDSLNFLEQLDIPFFKVPSGELTNGPLLWQFAKTDKPLLVSTGMSNLSEVEQALAIVSHAKFCKSEPANMAEVWRAWSHPNARSNLEECVTLLHCTSEYPAPIENANLRAMDTMRNAFDLPVGYSDHTQGILAPVIAAARGASIIEKHFTLSRDLPGPDHLASLEPAELAAMIDQIRSVQASLGNGYKVPQANEWENRASVRQQVAAAHDLPAGHVLRRDDLITRRLGQGLPASDLWRLIGKFTKRAFKAGEAITD